MMSALLRKMRGVMGISLTWGILWAAIGYAVAGVIGVMDPNSIDPGESPILLGAMTGFVGLISGAGFGILLSFAESQKTILELSLSRAAIWGILGSAALPLLTGMQDVLLFMTCPLGAAFAASSVAIAQKAELYDSEQQKLLN